MMDAWQARRESHLKVVTDAVDQKTFSFPGKIVVMTDNWHVRFSDQFGQGETERDIHRDRKGIFDNQQFDIIFPDELIETILEMAPQFMDSTCCLRWSCIGSIRDIGNCLNIYVQKMRLRYNKTNFCGLVGLTCEVIDTMPQPLQNVCPFLRLQR